MNHKKNILLLVEHFGQGGAEKVAVMLAEMLHNSGNYNVSLCSMYAPEKLVQDSEVKKHTLGLRTPAGFSDKLNNYTKAIRALGKLKKDLNIDLTISSLWPADWINALTGNDKKIGIIQINILNNAQNAKMVKFRRIVSTIYKRFDKVVLGGSNLMDEMTQFFKLKPDHLQVILNSINTKQIEKNIQEPLLPFLQPLFDKFNVLVVANRLHPVKNTMSLVEIYQRLHDKSATKILVLGEGEEKHAFEEKIKAAGLKFINIDEQPFDESADFFFLKFQKNIHNIINQSKIFLFPTKAEGLPLALMEAMYCDVPVLVSDCANGGIFEIMQGQGKYDMMIPRTESERTKGGYLMPIPLQETPDAYHQWADKIEEILAMDEAELSEMKAANRQRAASFDQREIYTVWEGLIEQLFTK